MFYLKVEPFLSRNLFATSLMFRIHVRDMSQGYIVVDEKAFWVWSIMQVAGVSGRKRKGTTTLCLHTENFQWHEVLWAGVLGFFLLLCGAITVLCTNANSIYWGVLFWSPLWFQEVLSWFPARTLQFSFQMLLGHNTYFASPNVYNWCI